MSEENNETTTTPITGTPASDETTLPLEGEDNGEGDATTPLVVEEKVIEEGPEWLVPDEAHPTNIQFVGKSRRYNAEKNVTETIPTPIDEIAIQRRDGYRVYDLPAGEIQKAGFWHKDASKLIRAFRDQFKRPVAKG